MPNSRIHYLHRACVFFRTMCETHSKSNNIGSFFRQKSLIAFSQERIIILIKFNFLAIMGGSFGDDMTFFQRVFNLFNTLMYARFNYGSVPKYQAMFESNYPGFPKVVVSIFLQHFLLSLKMVTDRCLSRTSWLSTPCSF